MDIENMNIEKATERCSQLIKPEHANWIGISNQVAIIRVLNELETSKKETQQVLDDYQDLGKEKYKLECELENKDKVINEMAKYIIDLIKYNNPEEERDKEEIKEYFANKVEKEGIKE